MKLKAKCAFTGAVDGIEYDKAEGEEFEVAVGKSALVLIALGVAEKATAKKATAKKKEGEDER